MKQETRNILKESFKIKESKNEKNSCKKCLYHKQKVCQIHMIKTKTTETCPRFGSQRTHKVYHGGGVSPK